MNQILVTEKLYVTPELKRKKKIYKLEFFLSVFILCILVSAYIYAEYDRNKGEEVSQEILADLDIPEDKTVAEDNSLVVVLNDEEEDYEEQGGTEGQESEQEGNENGEQGTQDASHTTHSSEIQSVSQDTAIVVNMDPKKTKNGGYTYNTVATISIPKINIKYPIIDGPTDSPEETEELLKISLTKFWGPEPNQVGNFCIVGHNYRNTKFFSKISTLEIGDVIEITDLTGKTIKYLVYKQDIVEPTDVSCTSQLKNGKKAITLITCTTDSKHRTIIKATEMK